jgi:hypothetical protein
LIQIIQHPFQFSAKILFFPVPAQQTKLLPVSKRGDFYEAVKIAKEAPAPFLSPTDFHKSEQITRIAALNL